MDTLGVPLDAPLYGLDPDRGIEYWNCRAIGAAFLADRGVADVLPGGLRLADDPPVGMVLAARYGGSTLGGYNELVSLVQVVDRNGDPSMYVPYIYVDNDAAMAAGREVLGAPKKLAAIELTGQHDIIQATLERPAGKRLATLTMRPSSRAEPGLIQSLLAPGTPLCSLRHLPAPPGGTRVHEIVKWSSEIIPHIDAGGEPIVFTGPASLTFDSPSAVDPVHRLGMGGMVACVYAEFDMRLRAVGTVATAERDSSDYRVPAFGRAGGAK
jgi:acetoacetate decarboxylase